MSMLRSLIAGAVVAILGASCAQAQTCPENFHKGASTVSTWQVFPGQDPAHAIDKLAQAGRASGFWTSVDVDRRGGIIRAENDGAGNGRTQAVTVTARRSGGSTRVDYAIRLEPGQIPGSGAYGAICKFLRNAAR
jgi:hypothetical protein